MKLYLLRYKIVAYVCGLIFFAFALEYIISFNFFPEHMMKTHPIPTVVKHYSVALPVHLEKEPRGVNSHVFLGLILILLGLIQLSYKMGKRNRRWHRILGTLYFLLGSITVLLGFKLSVNVLGGVATMPVFWIMGSLWFLSAGKAIHHALNRKINLHRRWVVRNYFLTIAPGLARPSYMLFDRLFNTHPPEILFPLANWLALVLAIVLSQWYIESSERSQLNE